MVLLLGLLCALPAAAQDAPAPPEPAPAEAASDDPVLQGSAITASLVVRVDDKKAAADAVVERAQALGGWFSRLEPESVEVRVPTARTDDLLAHVETLGALVQRDFQRQDHSEELATLDARIEGRTKILDRYREVLDEAQAGSVVSVERQITAAVSDLERLQGRRRFLIDRLTYSRVTVSFQFRDRRAPTRDGQSSFAWLNTMNVSDLVQDIRRGRTASRSRVDVPVPDGFVPYRLWGRFQAITPDAVALRVRSVRHKPEAELAFWKEALLERQKAAGYVILGEETRDGTYMLELGAADGPLDRAYVIGLRPSGRHLIIAEATGEASAFAKHRDAVVDAIFAMD